MPMLLDGPAAPVVEVDEPSSDSVPLTELKLKAPPADSPPSAAPASASHPSQPAALDAASQAASPTGALPGSDVDALTRQHKEQLLALDASTAGLALPPSASLPQPGDVVNQASQPGQAPQSAAAEPRLDAGGPPGLPPKSPMPAGLPPKSPAPPVPQHLQGRLPGATPPPPPPRRGTVCLHVSLQNPRRLGHKQEPVEEG